jgi:hypothetical protein
MRLLLGLIRFMRCGSRAARWKTEMKLPPKRLRRLSTTSGGNRRGRVPFILAAAGLAVYFANIAVGMAAVKLGWHLARLNDVWEFLIVLVSMIFFVAGLLAVEGVRPDKPPTY